jgi:two-component system nitrogen regulation response regulator GlnG
MTARILVVDDDAAVCWALERALERAGYRVAVCGTAPEALRRIEQAPPAVVLTDQRMPGGSGLDLMTRLRQERPRLPVVLMTAYGSMETAAKALAAGAYDYLPKPLDLDRTLAVVARAVGRREIAIEVAPSRQEGVGLVGTSPAMQEAVRRLALAAASDLPVLITGPTGCGKELAARLIHQHSRRAGRPFIPATAGLIAADDVRTALLGPDGLLAAAAGGTLLFDEVSDLGGEMQAALLGVLGGDADIRVIATSNRDLAACPAFRDDLLHRLAVMTIRMPSLAERLEDLPTLAGHLLARTSTRLGRPLALTDAGLALLQARPWPGDVRELRHVLEEAAALAPGGTIDAEHLRQPPAGSSARAPGSAPAEAERCLDEHPGEAHARWMAQHDRVLFSAAIARTRGNVLRAAEMLGVHRSTLRKRLDELGIGTGETAA